MSTYLDLVNKVIQESSSELDELTGGTWNTAGAGRRIYPRIKRNVRDAWKKIQMQRDDWEFMTAKLSTVIYPRIRFEDGFHATVPPAAGTYIGEDSGAVITIRTVLTEDGTFSSGTASGQVEVLDSTSTRLIVGETFTEVTPTPDAGTFTYLGKGDYSFEEINPDIAEVNWTTFTAEYGNTAPSPIRYVPWDNWNFTEYGYAVTSVTAPAYVTQDYKGRVAFYPQAFSPFRVTFVHSLKPQILEAYDDEPTRLPEAYHDWIAWEALQMFATFDKNPTLFAYGQKEATPYKLRAEKNLMPLMTYRPSAYNYE